MRKTKSQTALRVLVTCALLSAMSIVLKELSVNIGDVVRIGLENMPIALAAALYGAPYGIAVALVADLVGALMIYGSVIPGVTLGACAFGATLGIAYLLLGKIKRIPLALRVYLSLISAHLVGSVGIKTVALSMFYGTDLGVLLVTRALNYAIVTAIEGALLTLLLHSKAIKRLGIPRDKEKTKSPQNETEGVAMNYDEALEYIHSVSWTFCKPGLERTESLCRALGNPQDSLRFVHIAGTNGKGSTSSMLASVLTAAGYRTGLYTSPYIVRFNERMRVNGEPISDAELAEITSHVRPIADAMTDKPTEFELITAIAFEYFKRHGCDIVVLEAGMGGRLDSTNVITTPCLSVITNIALDHTAFLGDTTEKIAAEKAGIIKRGIPVIFGGDDSAAYSVIAGRAGECESTLITPDQEAISISSFTLDGTEFDYKDYPRVKLNLLGSYQPRNAAVVLEAVEILNKSGFSIPREAVYSGLASARWQARFEVLSREPLVIFDGAHNPDGITVATDSISRYFGNRRVVVLTGVLADKDYRFIAARLAAVGSHAYTITPDNPRALTAEDYAAALTEAGLTAEPTASVNEALTRAVARIRESGEPLVCLGSLYTYGEISTALEQILEK